MHVWKAAPVPRLITLFGRCQAYAVAVQVRTGWTLPAPPEAVWPLLCDSQLSPRSRCPVFLVGAPRPVACALPSGSGGVGAARQCVSEQGTVAQRIVTWEPSAQLAFQLESTELAFGSFVAAMRDDFHLEPASRGRATRVVRTTSIVARGWLRVAKYVALWVGLKSVHRFVFRNWQHQLADA